jgi:hypothetical protein
LKNEVALNFFANFAKKDASSPLDSVNKKNDLVAMDAEFVSRYVGISTSLCDFCSGKGAMLALLCDSLRRIVAVEPFREYTDQVVKKANIEIVNSTIGDFETSETFDLITFFGGAHYFNSLEIVPVYDKCYRLLKQKRHSHC